jgi:poly-gamma-glutamate capsule biosynthesis protein CapA/YwtB (metallophosphatase superfamily)
MTAYSEEGKRMKSNQAKPICLFLSGDVMTGRGIDRVLPHPADPVLYEPFVRDARDYVQLAESVHGPIPRPVDSAYIWGDALRELQRAEADARIVNLETSVTCGEGPWPGKGFSLPHASPECRLPHGSAHRLLLSGQQPCARLGLCGAG